jgi:hypothetical protein
VKRGEAEDGRGRRRRAWLIRSSQVCVEAGRSADGRRRRVWMPPACATLRPTGHHCRSVRDGRTLAPAVNWGDAPQLECSNGMEGLVGAAEEMASFGHYCSPVTVTVRCLRPGRPCVREHLVRTLRRHRPQNRALQRSLSLTAARGGELGALHRRLRCLPLGPAGDPLGPAAGHEHHASSREQWMAAPLGGRRSGRGAAGRAVLAAGAAG